jgi:PRTRC genetic system ThiF family protein
MILRHFLPSTFMRRKISVLLAGCGGTGSRILSGLAQIDVALRALGHPGLTIAVFDADRVSEANIGRQLFSPADIGRYKAEVLCTRINMFYGLSWRAVPMMVTKETAKKIRDDGNGPLSGMRDWFTSNSGLSGVDFLITAADSVKARTEIVGSVHGSYWMDTGNTKDSGQVVLGTRGKVPQPVGKNGKATFADAIELLPTVFDLYAGIADEGGKQYQGPSCSVADALRKQDLFVNQWVAMMACDILWDAFRHGYVSHHGKIVNLKTSSMRPFLVDPEMWARMTEGAKQKEYKRILRRTRLRLTRAAKLSEAKTANHINK